MGAARAGRARRFPALPTGPVAEPLVLLALYLGYTSVRLLVRRRSETARHHAHQILQLEQFLHLDVEASASTWLAAHTPAAVAASYWYSVLHFSVTPVVLLLLRRRVPWPTYRVLRDGLIIATGLALVGYALYPLMPPRLVGGYIDVLKQTAGYGWWQGAAGAPRGAGGLTNQYAAMPSMHVGWAVWCALAVTAMLPARRWRPLVWLYPLGSFAVVVATANHWVLDGVAGAALILLGLALARRRVS